MFSTVFSALVAVSSLGGSVTNFKPLPPSLPAWAAHFPIDLIVKNALSMDIDPCIAIALINVESGGITWRMAYEPKFRWVKDVQMHADRLGISYETELVFQRASIGLMQIMGSVARELSFKDYLVRLVEPELGLYWGMLKLKKELVRHDRNLWNAISSYNQGGAYRTTKGDYKNQEYVNKVSRYYHELRTPITIASLPES